MKQIMKKTLTALALPMLLSFGLASGNAQAEIVPGYYKGKFPHYGFGAKVFVYKTSETRGIGLIYGTNGEGSTFGSVFEINELSNGMQSWTQKFRDGNGTLSAEPGLHATYSARTRRTYKGRNKILLQLNPTEFGKDIGCTETLDVKRDDDWYVSNFPSGSMDYRGQGSAKGFIEPRSISGSLNINGEAFGGDFQILPLNGPGIGTIKAQSLDPNKSTGIREELDNLGLIATFRSDDWGHDDFYFFVTRPPTVSEITEFVNTPKEKRLDSRNRPLTMCLAPVAILKEK